MTEPWRLVDSPAAEPQKMPNKDQNKPPEKPAQSRRKAKPASKKPDQRQRPKRAQQPGVQQDDKAPIHAAVIPTETFPIEAQASAAASSVETAAASTEPSSKGALVTIDAFRIGTAVSVDTFWVGFQTIANAYGDYIRKSLDQTRSFLDTLSVARSPDKAMEIQTEFAQQACETLLSDSHRIWKLYSELARQVFRPFERLATWMGQPAR
jgi:phasin family protein